MQRSNIWCWWTTTRQQSPLGLIRGRGRPHPFWLSGMLCSRYGYLPYLRLKKFGRYKFGDFCYNFCCTFVLLGPWFSSSERSCYISFNTVLTCFFFFWCTSDTSALHLQVLMLHTAQTLPIQAHLDHKHMP